jgi:hypothetical protein
MPSSAPPPPNLMIGELDPKATNKHTLCGYAWSDVSSALVKAIGLRDMTRAQRWAAELVCSEQGLGKLEATLVQAWATHINSANPAWCYTWVHSATQIRAFWSKSGESTKAIRNTPSVRQLVAEAVGALVLSEKRTMPVLPTGADCFRDAEAIRTRFRTGKGAPEQLSCRRVWSAGLDSNDLRMIGNEYEAACRANNLPKAIFWVIWFMTLDTQAEQPPLKERGPAHLTAKQRKSVLWFLMELMKMIATDLTYLSTDERKGLFDAAAMVWPKLGAKGRRDVLVAITMMICEHVAKKSTLTLSAGPAIPSYDAIKSSNNGLDAVYSAIAEEARRFMLEVPKINGLMEDPGIRATAKLSAVDKMALAYSLIEGNRR